VILATGTRTFLGAVLPASNLITAFTTISPDVLDPRAPLPSVDVNLYVYLCKTPDPNVVIQTLPK